MKKHTIACILMAVCLMAQGGIQAADRTAEAKAFVRMLQNKQYVEADALCDDTVKQLMSAAQLQEIWEWLAQKYGTFGGVTGADTWKKDVYDIVQFPSRFGSTTMDIWVVYNQAGQISGLWFLNPSSGGPPESIAQALSAKSAEAQYKAPPYVRKERIEEYPIFVNEGGEWELPGTLTMPKGEGPFPAVVLVHGSGPNDRDETLGSNMPFRDIAWGLASRGIAVLRYDKRTKVHAAKLAKSLDKLTVREETTDDALAAALLLRTYERVDHSRIFVLGHSLGGMLISRIGTADPKIAGLIALAGPARPFEDVFLEQITYIASLKGTPSADDKKELEKVKQQVANVKNPKLSAKTPAASLPLGVPAAYWLDLRGYQPAEMAKSLKQPMLIMQGGRDYQVTETDFNMWKNALGSRTDVTLKLYPDLNHLFMTGVGKATPEEYAKHGTVADVVVRDISDWISGQQESGGVK